MLGLILILLLIWLFLTVVFWAGSLWVQSYIYSEPVSGLHWRAPAAGAAVTVFLALWCYLAYRGLTVGSSFLDFSAEQETEYPYFWSVEKGNQKVLYERYRTGSLLSGTEYVIPNSRPPRKWKRTDSEGRLVEAIIVEEGKGPQKKEVRFKLERPPGGFKEGEMARYVEEGGQGRVMTEDRIGRVSVQRTGLVAAYLLVNVFHLVLWFICLWLLLRYQWGHALLMAAGFWLFMTLWVVPQVLRKSEQAAPPKPPMASLHRRAAQPEARMCMISPSCTT